MKVVIFGTGSIYRKLKERVNMDIIAFIDNDPQKQGGYLDGKRIYSPEYVLHISFDRIILTSVNIKDMKRQLLDLGVAEDAIWTWRHFESELSRGILKVHCYHAYKERLGKRILVLSVDLQYNGGTLAAVHAVQALQLKGYQVVLAAPFGDPKFIEEMSSDGINIVLCPAICYPSQVEMYWIKQFDVVIVNVYQMLSCACEISKFRPVLWWIHEPSMSYSSIYENIREEFSKYDNLSEMKNINIAAVSGIAKKNFEVYYPQRVNHILPYGIPDEYNPATEEYISEKLTFAIIGYICKLKGQEIFLQAVSKFEQSKINQLEFLIIGNEAGDTSYCRSVRELAAQIPQIKLLGQLSREEMNAAFRKIDIIVCASMEETMSTVVVEGMMHGRICITTDATGVADYIVSGVNGIICKAGDANSLYRSMLWVVEHKPELYGIKKNARETYEKYFTLENFGERLEKILFGNPQI